VKQKEDGENKYYCSATVYFYASQEAYESKRIPVEGKDLYRDIDIEGNIVEQMYSYLKEQEYIAEAEDC